jgi:hypothetical protein
VHAVIAFVLLGLFFMVVAAAIIFGWGVDSRDSRFSLWPLYSAARNESRRRDGKRPDTPRAAAASRRRTKGAAPLPEGRDTVEGRVPRGAPGRVPVHVARQTVHCRREGERRTKADRL